MRLLIVIILAASFQGLAQNKVGGPPDAIVDAVAVDPANDLNIYATTDSGAGFFVSTDGGVTWTASVGAPGGAKALAFDTSTIYAGAFGAVYTSSDGGKTWAANSKGLPSDNVTVLYVDSSATSDPLHAVYAATGVSGVFKSIDHGVSWTAANTGLTFPSSSVPLPVKAFAADPSTSPSTVYAGFSFGSSSGGLFKTTNGGATWTECDTGLTGPQKQVNTLAVAPSGVVEDALFLGTNGGVFETSDRAATFTAGNSGLTSLQVNVLLANSAGDRFYAATAGGVFVANNTVPSWVFFNTGLPDRAVNAMAFDSGGVLAGTNGGGLFQSSATGWTGNSLPASPAVRALLLDSSKNPATLYVGTGSSGGGTGIFKTTNGGSTWIASTTGLPLNGDGPVNALAVAPDASASTGELLYAAIGSGVFRSGDSGATWSSAGSGLPGEPSALTLNGPSLVYAAEGIQGVYVTSDGGLSWFPMNNGFDTSVGDYPPAACLPASVTSLAFAKTGTPTGTVYAGTNCLVYESVNGATTWTTSSPLFAVSALAVAPNRPLTVYAGGDTLLDTLTGGASWIDLGIVFPADATTGGITALAVDPSSSSIVYAGTAADGILKTTNGGVTWNTVNTGLPNVPIGSLALVPAGTSPSTVIYAGTNGYGVYASTNAGASWSPTGIELTNIAQTITFGALSNRNLGTAPFALSATASSLLTVTFISNTPAVCTVSGVEVTILTTGACWITASQAGNAFYAAAPSVSQTFTVSSAGPPAIVSLSPGAGAGKSVTFKAVYSDPNGAGELSELLLQVNTAQSSANACYVYYQPQGNHLYLANNAGAFTMPALTPGLAGTAFNSQCTLNAVSSSVTMAGDDLTLSVAVTFSSTVVGSRNVYLYAADGHSGQNSGWVKEGMWVPTSAGPPGIVSLSPNSGSGMTATFKAVYSDANGAGDLNELLLQVNASQSSANACYVYYQPQGNHLYLANNGGTWMTPALTPGVAGTASNSQCSLNAGSSSVTTSGNDLTFSVALNFSGTFAGSKNVYLYAGGYSGQNSGWVKEGTWTPNAAGPPAIVSLSPDSGSGMTATFKAVYSDPDGAGDLSTLLLQINGTQSSANACYVYYQPQGNRLYLANNAGAWIVTPVLTPGVAGTVSNSQCTLNAGSSSVSSSGNDLTLNVAVSFIGTFTGAKNVYLYAAGSSGKNSGWVKEGTWTP
jgi:hypothetical protein